MQPALKRGDIVRWNDSRKGQLRGVVVRVGREWIRVGGSFGRRKVRRSSLELVSAWKGWWAIELGDPPRILVWESKSDA